jgi:hypothetical protein
MTTKPPPGLCLGVPELSPYGHWHAQIELVQEKATPIEKREAGLFAEIHYLHARGEQLVEQARNSEAPGDVRVHLWEITGHATAAWHALIRGQQDLAREHVRQGTEILNERRHR